MQEIKKKIQKMYPFIKSSIQYPKTDLKIKNRIMNSNVDLVKNILKYTFGIVPIVAGFDKFSNILTDWTQYLSSGFLDMLPFDASSFMMIVGIIEVLAGALVLSKTKIGTLVVAAWLTLISLTLLFSWSYVDVAVRDLVMAVAAFCCSKLYSDELVKAKN